MDTEIVFVKNYGDGKLAFKKTFGFLIPSRQGENIELLGYEMKVTYQSVFFLICTGGAPVWCIKCKDEKSAWSQRDIEDLEHDGWKKDKC